MDGLRQLRLGHEEYVENRQPKHPSATTTTARTAWSYSLRSTRNALVPFVMGRSEAEGSWQAASESRSDGINHPLLLPNRQ